ncbi:MAG: membrane protein insertase YidC [Gammaproteobacteria bacterium]|nr:MAG: membrane protein insertase YidC [Gammaproteobacteria bacterium]
MDQRNILIIALLFVMYLMWQAWQEDYGSKPTVETAPTTTTPMPGAPKEVAVVPSLPDDSTLAAGVSTRETPPPDRTRSELVHVVTDTLDVELDTRGGEVRSLKLLKYPVSLSQPETPLVLMDRNKRLVFTAQSGLISKQGAPDHFTLYQPEQNEYRLTDGQETLVVDMSWRGNDGVTVVKRYTFKRGRYDIEVSHLVDNQGTEVWQGRQYRQLERSKPGESDTTAFVYTFTGAALYSPDKKFEKISFDDIQDEDLERVITGGWVAMLQHYFVSAWVPDAKQANHYYTDYLKNGNYVIGLISGEQVVPAGGQTVFTSRIYAGPKLQDVMSELAEGLNLTVDYGWLTVIAQPIFWLLKYIHNVIGNWGWSIILLTLIIKLVFFKLSETSYRSMAQMRRVQPRLASIKERYGDDKQKINQAMMKLYKEEKINPVSGCLPILVQIPVFIALYWVLLESVELRQAPFMFWIKDMSTPDPYFVLPLIMGITMFLQQRLNPQAMDPMQQKMMSILPVVFTVFFLFFPSGLVLYWVVNNILSISQQWVITRRIEGVKSK